jgi:hypothetical protein
VAIYRRRGGRGPYGGRGGPWNAAWWRELGGESVVELAEVEDIVRIKDKLIQEFQLEIYRP